MWHKSGSVFEGELILAPTNTFVLIFIYNFNEWEYKMTLGLMWQLMLFHAPPPVKETIVWYCYLLMFCLLHFYSCDLNMKKDIFHFNNSTQCTYEHLQEPFRGTSFSRLTTKHDAFLKLKSRYNSHPIMQLEKQKYTKDHKSQYVFPLIHVASLLKIQ